MMASLSVPVASRLPSSLRLAPFNPTVTRVLGRLSRPSLLSLALDWLDPANQALTAPYLRPQRPQQRRGAEDTGDGEYEPQEEEDDDLGDFYPPALSLDALQQQYASLQARNGAKREVLDRMLEGDWRQGLTMYQLAMADLQYLYDHPTCQKWTAFRIVPLKAVVDSETVGGDGSSATAEADKSSLVVPRFHPSTFLRNLQAQILPDVKVHYNFDRHKSLPLLLLRIFILDSPYNTSLATSSLSDGGQTAAETSRTVYVAFPDASPFVYLSSAQSAAGGAGDQNTPGSAARQAAPSASAGSRGEARSLRSLVVEAIPKALSRPRERYALQPTNLATRNLTGLLHRRGAGRSNTAGGGWGIYADEKKIESPLSTALPTPPLSDADDKENLSSKSRNGTHKRAAVFAPEADRERKQAKRRRLVAQGRFGPSAKIGDGKGVERVDIVVLDPFPAGEAVQMEEDEGEEQDAADSNAPQSSSATDRRKSRGGRRSQIDATLAREAEEDEDSEASAEEVAGQQGDHRNSPRVSSDATWRPRVGFTFHGSHVFAGIRQLVEAGIIDGEKMPGWMTGEEGVTVGAVRHGRIRGHKGSGMA